jgi:hypothetical protein
MMNSRDGSNAMTLLSYKGFLRTVEEVATLLIRIYDDVILFRMDLDGLFVIDNIGFLSILVGDLVGDCLSARSSL